LLGVQVSSEIIVEDATEASSAECGGGCSAGGSKLETTADGDVTGGVMDAASEKKPAAKAPATVAAASLSPQKVLFRQYFEKIVGHLTHPQCPDGPLDVTAAALKALPLVKGMK
jgi:hypothetical protein